MRFSSIVSALTLVVGIASAGRSLKHVGREDKPQHKRDHGAHYSKHMKRQSASNYLTEKTASYAVNGTAIPEVDFDVGESYAGLMSITDDPKDEDQFYFWFFPTENPDASDEIMIWLNGGPGCSSLEGLLQENGPFLWQYGTFAPVPNPYSWTNLTNVVWIEQPVGTGFSTGTPSITSETELAAQFLGFWKNFMTTFALEGRKVYITGESYAGAYVPYIADAMLNTNNTQYYNLEGIMINDPVISPDATWEIAAVQLADNNPNLMPFNDTFKSYIHNISASCGYDDYISEYLVFPPSGFQPTNLPGTEDDGQTTTAECDVGDAIFNAALVLNPCFDIYQIATTCPVLWDVLGFPGSFDYTPAGADIYFNRTDVKAAINAPLTTNWNECNDGVFINNTDTSLPSGNTVLPGVIERSARTIIAHAALDMVLIANQTMLAIQNMTWGGKLGFQTQPTEPLYVPQHDDPSLSTLAGSGILGTAHTERGLTFIGVDLSGHMIPQYAPSVAYRMVEFLLGRIPSLSTEVPFTTDPFPQYNGTLGNGTTLDEGSGTTPPYKMRRAPKAPLV